MPAVTHCSSLLQKNDELLMSQFSKPKQKRHRCRNPNKIDINTLTGEERVPVVNRRNGRKVGSGRSLLTTQQLASTTVNLTVSSCCRWAEPWLHQ